MATKDPTFLGKLKTAWDIHFKKNPKIVMILSGLMSNWIESNILNSTGFFGRVDLDMILTELPLPVCNEFWGSAKISAFEKFKTLCITGGVPRYLETINPKLSTEENVRRLFFQKESLFFKEFDNIFTDIFHTRALQYKNIVTCLSKGDAQQDEIFSALELPKSGIYSEYLNELVQTGYITRDYTWLIKKAKVSKLSKYRLSDNYIRFYLKYIEPIKEAIKNDRAIIPTNWHSIMGLQFENMVLNNRKFIFKAIGVDKTEILLDNPYFARKTKTHKGVQIDYMIQTKFNNIYVCEIKFHTEKIGMKVVSDVKEKIERLQLPKGFSVRPVLIHVNGISEDLIDSQYFAHTIDFSELLDDK